MLSYNSVKDLNFLCWLLLFSRLVRLSFFLFLSLSIIFVVVFLDVWYSMSDIDVIFVIAIPSSLTGKNER